MAVIETWLKSDLKKPVAVVQLTGNLFSGDNGGNKIGVEVLDNGSPATLSGGVTGYIIRADGATVVQTGTLSGNKAYIVLPESAYVVVGHVSIVIKVGTTTVGACTSYVYRTTTSVIVDPGSVVPDISELLAVIADCEAATTAANTAATAAGYVNIAMTKSGKTITITTTNRSNQQTSKTLVEPSASVTKSSNVITISVTDADGTTTQTMLDPANTLAPAFDSSASYNVGDLCIKDGVLYVFTSAHTGAWNAGDAVATNFAEQLTSGLDTKAPAIEVTDSTASPVKTLTDGADGMPMSATFEIAPVQDLHGYDHPWPGGGGKNIFNGTVINGYITDGGEIGTDGVNGHSDYIQVTEGETYTYSCTANYNTEVNRRVHGYDADKQWVEMIQKNTDSGTGDKSYTFTVPSGIKYIMVQIYWPTTNIPRRDTNIQIELGSSKTSYAPYENRCPITGWTGCKPTATGTNLCKLESGKINTTTGAEEDDESVTRSGWMKVTSGEDYFFSGLSGNIRIFRFDEHKNLLGNIVVNASGGILRNFSEGTVWVRFQGSNSVFSNSVQVEKGSSATPYQAFGKALNISFPDGAGTVYGCALTVNKDGTGKLVVDRIAIVMDSSKVGSNMASKEGFYGAYYNDSSIPRTNNVTSDLICDVLPAKMVYSLAEAGIYANGSAGQFGMRVAIGSVREQQSTQAGNIRQFIDENNPTLSYKLETPVSYDLTALEVIETLKGVNNIFCDTGDVLSVDYSADTKLYVDEQNEAEDAVIADIKDMIADSDSMTTTESHAQGDVFICDNKLLRALSAIASGASITIGTNAEVINLASYIAEQATAIVAEHSHTEDLIGNFTEPFMLLNRTNCGTDGSMSISSMTKITRHMNHVKFAKLGTSSSYRVVLLYGGDLAYQNQNSPSSDIIKNFAGITPITLPTKDEDCDYGLDIFVKNNSVGNFTNSTSIYVATYNTTSEEYTFESVAQNTTNDAKKARTVNLSKLIPAIDTNKNFVIIARLRTGLCEFEAWLNLHMIPHEEATT